ncbi:MAG: hypothetical protein HUU01_14250 [Saprospiraceae bacterium]|nr:hypothetical protein [Saprospiraceae bacterium]
MSNTNPSVPERQTSVFERAYDPLPQALVTFAAVLVVILGSKLVKLTGLLTVSERFPWMAATAFLLFFAMLNSVFSLSTKSMMRYWGRSVYCFMGLATASGLVAWLFSSLSIGEAGSYRWLYVVVTFGYLVFLSIVTFMRNIVDFAQREEWNQPRWQSKKRR